MTYTNISILINVIHEKKKHLIVQLAKQIKSAPHVSTEIVYINCYALNCSWESCQITYNVVIKLLQLLQNIIILYALFNYHSTYLSCRFLKPLVFFTFLSVGSQLCVMYQKCQYPNVLKSESNFRNQFYFMLHGK